MNHAVYDNKHLGHSKIGRSDVHQGYKTTTIGHHNHGKEFCIDPPHRLKTSYWYNPTYETLEWRTGGYESSCVAYGSSPYFGYKRRAQSKISNVQHNPIPYKPKQNQKFFQEKRVASNTDYIQLFKTKILGVLP